MPNVYARLYTTEQVSALLRGVVSRQPQQCVAVSTGDHVELPPVYCVRCGSGHGVGNGVFMWTHRGLSGEVHNTVVVLCERHNGELLAAKTTVSLSRMCTLHKHTSGVWTLD